MTKGLYRFLPIFTGLPVSSGPVVFAKDTLLERDVSGGFAEMHVAGEAPNLVPERQGNVVEAGGRNFFQVAPVNFVFEFFELTGEAFPALLASAKNAQSQRLGFGGAQVGDGELVLTAPLDEGRLGHLKFVGDLIKAASLRAQEDEACDDFLITHTPASIARDPSTKPDLEKPGAKRSDSRRN